jgi:predicted ester cyclase
MSVSAEENKVLVRRFFEEAWIKRNPAAVDVFVAAGYVEHAGIPGSRSSGRDSLKELIALYHGAFPDLRSTIEDIFAAGDKVAYRWSARGTHLGEWAGISPTGDHITASGITIFRLTEDKKIVEGWVSADLRRSEEELRWLTESGRVREASPESGDVPFDPYTSAYDALVRNLTWRIPPSKRSRLMP